VTELFRPDFQADETRCSPSEATMGEVLSPVTFSDLYQLVRDEGLPYFARMNGVGDVELYLVFESIDAFSDATRDAVFVEFKTYKQTLLAVIWTLIDPREPLGFPLSFDIKQEEQRYMALRMAEQPELWIHYLAYTNAEITHIYSEASTFSRTEKEHVEYLVRYLFEAQPNEQSETVAAHEVKEEEMVSIPAASMPEYVLAEPGTAYLLDYARLVHERGEEGAQSLLMSTVQQAALVMRRHARSEVRESAYTIWAGEQEGTLWLFVTPMLYSLFEVLHRTEDEANPFARFLYALPVYIETVDASPLECGAFPILRYENGKLYHLELDETAVARMAEVADKQGFGKEPYLHT
jgi:hypothetical protein